MKRQQILLTVVVVFSMVGVMLGQESQPSGNLRLVTPKEDPYGETGSATATRPAPVRVATAPATVPAIPKPADTGKMPGPLPQPTTGPQEYTGTQPGEIPGLLAWLKSDEGVVKDQAGKVSQWSDLRGAQFTFKQGEEASRPTWVPDVISGRPVMRFDGGRAGGCSLVKTDWMKFQGGRGLTFIVLARMRPAVADPARAVCSADAVVPIVPDRNRYNSLKLMSYGDPGPAGNPRGGSFALAVEPDGRFSAATMATTLFSRQPSRSEWFRVFQGRYDLETRELSLHENGVLAQKAQIQCSLSQFNSLTLGNPKTDRLAEAEGFSGDIAEVLIYDRALTDAQSRTVVGYMRARYPTLFADISDLAHFLPFAYYPSLNKLEAAFDLTAAEQLLPAGKTPGVERPKSIQVEILSLPANKPAAVGKLPLNADGRGRGLIELPDLPDGEYAVEYVVADQRIRAAKTFSREHFPWEKSDLGLTHKVYPPFVPVKVDGRDVSIVDRIYRMNAFGMFDSVKSLGRELLAAPIRVVCQTADGEARWDQLTVEGNSVHEDLAVFESVAASDAVVLASRSSVEEDGCVKVEMTLKPGKTGKEIQRMWIEVPLKDQESPLFHYVGDNTMRHNYGGLTPRGGRIAWDTATMFRSPVVWRAQAGPADGLIWDATQVQDRIPLWYQAAGWDTVPFVPYVWLGSEMRGLAWFGDSAKGYLPDWSTPVQTLWRKGDHVVLRIDVIQVPTRLAGPRQIVFGLQASPTKPLPQKWRTMDAFPHAGPVNCWGGYLCSSKYPDKRDFTIVDKIIEGWTTRKVDKEFFQKKDAQREYKDRKVNGNWPWLESVLYFAGRVAGRQGLPCSYQEEHATDPLTPEWLVFRDEWSDKEFSRYQPDQTPNWTAFPESYRNFALYYDWEWMRRGVSLYFDNCCPRRTSNPGFSQAFRTETGDLRFANSLFDLRAYYRRVWKLMNELNEHGMQPEPIEFTMHMTNTQVLPMHTWCTSNLDIEHTYRWDASGPLPFPADYLRAVTMGRRMGCISFTHFPIRNKDLASPTDRQSLSDWGMNFVHELRSGAGVTGKPSVACRAAVTAFGYGKDDVQIHNYWEEKPFVSVDDAEVKWIALMRAQKPAGLLVIQSYRRDAVEVAVRFPDGKVFQDVLTGERLVAGASGELKVPLTDDYGTRVLLVAGSEEDLASPRADETTKPAR